MLTRPDITRLRPNLQGPRPRPNHGGRGRKVYRYGRINDSCNYVTYFGNVIKGGQSNLTKSASWGPIPRLGVPQGVESCTIEFLG